MTESEAKKIVTDNPRIVENEREFRQHVVVQLALINQQARNDRADIDKLERCVFGPDGDAGLVDEIKKLRNAQTWWNRGLTIAQVAVVGLLTILGLTKQ
jgi:hypothetical protein